MKIANGIMAQLPYTPPRTQLCIVELEDVCVTASGAETTDKILAPKNEGDVTLNGFENATTNPDEFDFGKQDY